MPIGPAELVRGDDRHVARRQRELARALRAIGQQQAARLADDARDRGQVLAIAGLRIDLLDRDQRALAPDRFGQALEIERTVGVHRQAFARGRGLEHAIMFDRAHQPRAGLGVVQGQRRRFAGARGEDHLA